MTTKLGTPIADFETQLATAIDVAGTTATLQSATDDDAVALPTGRYFFTLDMGNSVKEHISCDLNGTALTNIKSVSRQGVETTGVARAHRIGASVTITDFAHIKYMNDLLSGATLFNSLVKLGYDADPSINSGDLYKFATVTYVNGVAIAGAPDAGALVKGISYMSVAPASPTSPISVGDNDPRVPTQNENNAMVGTSGTPPSTSNKFVDDADTTATNAAAKVARFDSNGELTISRAVKAYVYKETISIGDPLSLYPYQVDGGVLKDTSGASGNGSTGQSITIGNNSNRALVVFATAVDNSTVPTATFGGIAMTAVQTQGASVGFYINAPAVGAGTLVLSTSCAYTYHSIYNVSQTGQPEVSEKSTSNTTESVTTLTDGAIVLASIGSGTDNLTTWSITGQMGYYDGQSGGGNLGKVYSISSGQVFTPQAIAGTINTAGSGCNYIAMVIAPAAAVVYGGVFKSSSATNVLSQFADKYTFFVGFAKEAGVLGDTKKVTIGGVVPGLTLTPHKLYYLNDTAGTIGITAGANSKKIGQSHSATELNLIQVI